MLGAGNEARAGIDYEMTFQQPNGRFQVLPRFFKENGIVLWTWTGTRADAGQGVAAVGLAAGRKNGGLHQAAAQGELRRRLAAERWPDAAGRR